METLFMKIRDKFIDLIINGTKTREYRLSDPQRSAVKMGDILVLVSNSEPTHFVRVEVTGVSHYKNWEDALSVHWKEDFSSLFPSFESALAECRRFYEKKEVDQYGIVIFDIKPLVAPSFKKAFVLLDTNIVIQRESYNNLSEETIELYRWLDRLGSTKYLHPSIKEEIAKNTNEISRNGLLAKLNAYTFLNPSNGSSSFFKTVTESYPINQNSLIDNELLFEVYLGKVDFLITNDKEMLRKATDLFIKDRVLNVEEYLELVERLFPSLVTYKMLRIKQESFDECNLDDPFFASLREDYNFSRKNEFDTWFAKKTKERAMAYVYRDNNQIKGFLYLKTEDVEEEKYEDINPILPPKRRLKIGTFKNETKGMRVGERFLKIIFDNAKKQNVKEIYVTLFEKHRPEIDALDDLFRKWGFVFWGKKKDGETVLVKTLEKYDETKGVVFNFPLTRPDCGYFFIPIESEYHTDLFPDYILTNENVSFYSNGKTAHRYAIEKVYVSGKDIRYVTAKPGDIVVIYRKGDRWPKKYSSVVTGTAVIEKIVSPATLDDYLKECKNVTVFSEEELTKFYLEKKFKTVIKLIQLESFNKKITANFLQENGIIEMNGGARTLQPMSAEQFRLIINTAIDTAERGN